MVVSDPGTVMSDPNSWQPLSLGLQLSQNGLPIPGNVQEYIGPHWGYVTSFALPESPTGTPIDPGPPPRLGDPATDAEFKQAALDVLRDSSLLDPSQSEVIDVSPASMGDNALGTNDGSGYDRQPGDRRTVRTTTDRGRRPLPGDRRVLGRRSDVRDAAGPLEPDRQQSSADTPGFERRFRGEGPELDPLEWDVKTYFALNGAVHDAAIAGWGLKAYYDSVRPISMIRYMGGLGQSSDPAGPSYDPDGLPLEAGLVEVITAESSAPGERHESLADHVGEIAVYAWRGSPEDPETETSGVGWIRAVDWVPYQRPTFVTPSFAGYVSGHSTFSRAAAEVLTGSDRNAVLPGRARRRGRSRRGSCCTRKVRPRTSTCSGPRTTTHPTRRASPGSTGASTSRRTTSRDASSVRRSGWAHGSWRRPTSMAPQNVDVANKCDFGSFSCTPRRVYGHFARRSTDGESIKKGREE